MAKGFFIDLTKCTACRGCQVACKQWKKLPATETENWGSHQNPKDLNFSTYKLVRFEEQVVEGDLKWLFFPEQCRHCIDAPCKLQGDLEVEDAILVDEETGAVIFTEKTSGLEYGEGSEFCPYNIPRQDPETKVWSKCNMCVDRVKAGMLPACVTTCPTGAMNFGELEDMKAMAQARLAEAKAKFPSAVLGNPEDVRVIFLFAVDPALYYSYAAAELNVPLYNRKQMFAKMFKDPMKRILT